MIYFIYMKYYYHCEKGSRSFNYNFKVLKPKQQQAHFKVRSM